jgi:hypothetical protein
LGDDETSELPSVMRESVAAVHPGLMRRRARAALAESRAALEAPLPFDGGSGGEGGVGGARLSTSPSPFSRLRASKQGLEKLNTPAESSASPRGAGVADV